MLILYVKSGEGGGLDLGSGMGEMGELDWNWTYVIHREESTEPAIGDAAPFTISQKSYPIIRFLMTKYEPADLTLRTRAGIGTHRIFPCTIPVVWNLPVSARFSLKMMEYSSKRFSRAHHFK